jgi:hypothetical protein
MSSQLNPKGLQTVDRSFLASLRELLTPTIWKQAEKARHSSRRQKTLDHAAVDSHAAGNDLVLWRFASGAL